MSLAAEKLNSCLKVKDIAIPPVNGDKLTDYLGRVSVIMPAYNEGSMIFASIQETAKVLKAAKCDFEIIIADDGKIGRAHV